MLLLVIVHLEGHLLILIMGSDYYTSLTEPSDTYSVPGSFIYWQNCHGLERMGEEITCNNL